MLVSNVNLGIPNIENMKYNISRSVPSRYAINDGYHYHVSMTLTYHQLQACRIVSGNFNKEKSATNCNCKMSMTLDPSI